MECNLPPIQLALDTITLRVKQTGLQADYSLLSSTEVKESTNAVAILINCNLMMWYSAQYILFDTFLSCLTQHNFSL
jgi:hypothetical protein